jgi:hypothetical protein
MSDEAISDFTRPPGTSAVTAAGQDQSGDTPGAGGDAALVALEDVAPERPFPWPPAEGEGVLAAAGRTWFESVFQPASFFRRMPRDAPIGPALLWFIAVTVLASGVELFWEMALLAVRPPTEDSVLSFFAPTSAREALLSFLFAPFIMLAVLFLAAGVWHVLLRMMGGASQRYGVTARVFAYVQGPRLFAVAPFLGTIVGAVWSVVIAIVGLREAHGTSTGKAATAVLLPIVLVLGLFLVLAVILAAGALLLQPFQ